MEKFIFLAFVVTLSFNSHAWEPSQEQATKIKLTYDLFEPFGLTEISISTDNLGKIDHLTYSTDLGYVEISPDRLEEYNRPSLADIEVMHYGAESLETGLGGTFSLCIPYGQLSRVEGEEHCQRNTLTVLVTPEEEIIGDIPIPEKNMEYIGTNGCEISSLEVYGF